MRRKIAYALGVLVALVVVPASVSAEEVTVKSQEELMSALNNSDVSKITLGSDIETTGKINITRNVTIDGDDHTIKYVGQFFSTVDGEGSSDNTIWSKKSSNGTLGAVYVVQVYCSDVTIKDINLTNGNRAIGVNGGKLTLDGTVDVSGNGFDAIELSHGTAVSSDKVSTLVVSDETFIVNNSENDSNSTLFVDDADAMIIRIKDGKSLSENVTVGKKLSADEINVNVIEKIANDGAVIDSNVFKDIANNKNLILTTADGKVVWVFDGNKVTDTNISVNTGITFTNLAPDKIKSDVSKVTNNYKNMTFLNFSHSGKLPGVAEVTYKVDDVYAIGTKLYVAHFNETTKKLEKVQEVKVDEDGYITFNVEECSSYVLYTGTGATDSATVTVAGNTTTSNPKTGDINLFMILSVIVGTIIGLKYVSKKIALSTK